MKHIFKILVPFFAIIIIIAGYFIYMNYKQKDFRNNIQTYIPGIACWGDSLTYGAGGNGVSYPSILEDLLLESGFDIPVYNLGVGGESTLQIMTRRGVYDIETTEDITIPSTTEAIQISLAIHTDTGYQPLAILRQGNAGVETVTISGIEGTLSIQQESISSENYVYYFQRATPGREMTIKEGTKLSIPGAKKYNNCIPIIFMGTNGLWSSPDDLVQQCRQMLYYQFSLNADRYLILGLTTGTADERKDLESVMENAFGKRYINLREYLSSNGLEDAGIEPTEQDREAMEKGEVPPSLKSDEIHLNQEGYTLIGKKVFERMKEIGYFDYKIKV